MAKAKKNLETIQKKLKLAALKKEVAALQKANLIKSSFQLNDKSYDSLSKFLANVFSDQQSERNAAKASSGDFVNGTLDPKKFIEEANKAEGVGVKLKIMITEASSSREEDEDEDQGKNKELLGSFNKRVADIEPAIIEASQTSAGREAKSKLAEAKVGAEKGNFADANGKLDEVERILAASEEDDGERLITEEQLKLFIKGCRKKPYPFACVALAEGVGIDFILDKPAKKPRPLSKKLMKKAGGGKVTFGMAILVGKVLELDLEIKALPGNMIKKMKNWLKEKKPLPANKVRLK